MVPDFPQHCGIRRPPPLRLQSVPECLSSSLPAAELRRQCPDGQGPWRARQNSTSQGDVKSQDVSIFHHQCLSPSWISKWNTKARKVCSTVAVWFLYLPQLRVHILQVPLEWLAAKPLLHLHPALNAARQRLNHDSSNYQPSLDVPSDLLEVSEMGKCLLLFYTRTIKGHLWWHLGRSVSETILTCRRAQEEGRLKGYLLAVGHVSGRGHSGVVKVLKLIHPHLCCSPRVPVDRPIHTMLEYFKKMHSSCSFFQSLK